MSASNSSSFETHRLRKKQRTRARILANAIALFRKAGIRNTRSLEIAAASDVSPATLFNYFATKNDLAEAWVRGEIGTGLDALAAEAGDRGIRSGLRSRCRDLAEASWAERDLRLEAWRSAGRAATATLRHTASLEALIAREQDRARLRADLPARVLAEMIAEAVEGGLISGLRESTDAKQFAAGLRARIDVVLDGARKRNERVSAPSPPRL
jgi:AcrR family transcriptional regulator